MENKSRGDSPSTGQLTLLDSEVVSNLRQRQLFYDTFLFIRGTM